MDSWVTANIHILFGLILKHLKKRFLQYYNTICPLNARKCFLKRLYRSNIPVMWLLEVIRAINRNKSTINVNVINGSVANGGINAKFSNEINNDEFLDPLSTIKNIWLSNVHRVVIGNLNINSLTNNFNQLKELVLKYVVILDLTILFQIRSFQLMDSLNHLGLTEIDLEVG